MNKEIITKDLFDWIQSMGSEEITSFIGPFSYPVINEKLFEIKRFLNEHEFEKRKTKLVYAILVEALENVIKHSDYKGYSAAFMIHHNSQEFYITVVNPLSKESSIKFLKSFNILKDLSVEEINEKKLYQLKNGSISDRGGAGFGVMEIMIKSNKNVECSIKEVEEDVQVLILNITVK